MVRPDRDLLSGGVEVGETFVGGVSMGTGGGGTDTVPVRIAVESSAATGSDGCASPSSTGRAPSNSLSLLAVPSSLGH